jgi:hypothetical protein
VSEIFSYDILLWLHVLVMGYWIGSDLVVNALTFYVVRSASLPAGERKRLWDFLIHVDQHPRNALIVSVPLGFTLAAEMGLVPLDDAALMALWAASAVWFGYMWLAHWKRQSPAGAALAKWDWRTRYLLIAAFVAMGAQSLATGSPLEARWLAWKVILFAAVMACGIGIRYYMRQTYRSWPRIWEGRGTAEDEALVVRAMTRATRVLWLLWALLFVIGWLGVVKPGLQ